MGAYKYWNPATQKYEIIKSKSIVKEDGSLEYTPDDIKAMDDKIGILNDVSNEITIGTIKPTDGATMWYEEII